MKKKKGIALIFIFFIIAVLAVMGSAIVSRSVSERFAAEKYAESIRTFWLGEAGIEAALNQLKQNWYNQDSASKVSLSKGEGTYSFDIYDTDKDGNPLPEKTLRIVSTGEAGGVSKSLEVIIKRFVEVYDYAVFGVNLVELKAGTTVHGDGYSDGNVEVQVGASVVKADPFGVPVYDADFYYTGDTANIYGTVEGDVIKTTEEIPLPSFDWAEFKAEADYILPGGTTLTGNLDGVYYVTGTVTVEDATLTGAIIAENSIEINGNFNHTSPEVGFPALANKEGTIELYNSGGAEDEAVVRGLIYCHGTGLELKTAGASLTVYGSVTGVTADVEIKSALGSIDIYYDENYLTGFPLSSSIEVLSWKEEKNPYPLTN